MGQKSRAVEMHAVPTEKELRTMGAGITAGKKWKMRAAISGGSRWRNGCRGGHRRDVAGKPGAAVGGGAAARP